MEVASIKEVASTKEALIRAEVSRSSYVCNHNYKAIMYLLSSVRPQSNSPGGGIRPNPQQPHNVGQPNNFNRGPSNKYDFSILHILFRSSFHPAPKTSSNTFGKALLGGAAGALGGF